MKSFLSPLLALALLAVPASVRALTDAEAVAGRAIVQRYADAVVSIQLVVTVNVSVGGRSMPPREIPTEVNGTVLSPAGLTVTSLSLIDPRSSITVTGAAGRNMQMGDTQFKEVKLRLSDGTEIPARVVLKDADTDLAFVAPEAGPGGRVFPAVDLQHAATGQVLATYFDVLRASREMQRVPLVSASSIIGIVPKPRKFFLVTGQSAGCPMFDAQGAILGICVRHIANGRAGNFVVMPASQVAEIAQQAAAEAAKPPPEPAPAADDAKLDAPSAPTAPAKAPEPAAP